MCYPSQEPSTWLVRSPAPLSALQQLLVASMALGMDIQKQVFSWWPFSLILFPPTWSFGNAKSVLGLWWDIWVANVEIIHYVQGMLETYISGAHIQVDQRQSHAWNIIVAYGGHCDYGIWGPGYWCAGPTLCACKFVSQRLCMYWRPVWNHWYSRQSCEWPNLFYWRFWKLHLVWLILSWNQ